LQLRQLRPQRRHVLCVALSADGKIWDLEAGKLALTLSGHTGLVTCLALAADGKRLYSGSADRTVRVWDFGGD
jgi:WD40 repeat protein